MSSNTTENQPSSLQAAYNSISGSIQSGIASLTGSAGDQAQANQTKEKAQAESDLSHAGAKVGPFAVSSSGAVAKDNSDRSEGSWNQTVGSAKETVGNLLGNESLKQQGREQNLQGQEQQAKGQLSDLGQGVGDRLTGTIGSAVAGLTGNTEAQKAYADQHDEGKSRQRGVELELQKQAEAENKGTHT